MTMVVNTDNCLTAADVMTCDVVTLHERVPADVAAEILRSKSICGAPVINDLRQCVGVFSTVDFFQIGRAHPDSSNSPEICPYQLRHRHVDGYDVKLCTLPAGQCSLQCPETEEGRVHNTCRCPHEIVVEWQLFEPKPCPTDPVMRWMSAIPVTVNSTATVIECAERMRKAGIQSLIVVDDDEQVVGILDTLEAIKAIAECDSLVF